jgi:hypothetical protein
VWAARTQSHDTGMRKLSTEAQATRRWARHLREELSTEAQATLGKLSTEAQATRGKLSAEAQATRGKLSTEAQATLEELSTEAQATRGEPSTEAQATDAASAHVTRGRARPHWSRSGQPCELGRAGLLLRRSRRIRTISQKTQPESLKKPARIAERGL